MKRGYFIILLPTLLVSIYVIVLYLQKPQIFNYKFDPSLIKKYYCSQDIPTEPPCKRLFLSDGEIHISAGYLYMKGEEPTRYNFQHPPFIKYLYGISTIVFGNPFFIQIFFGVALIIVVYLLGLIIYRSLFVSTLSGVLLISDPLFIDLSSQALLDLGQSLFIVLYVLSFLFYKKNYCAAGIILGLMSASKFWGASIFIVIFIALYKILKHQFNIKFFILHLIIAFIVFCLVYIKTFMDQGVTFNIIFFQLKTFKYWMDHSVSIVPFGTLLLFMTGHMQIWWHNREVVQSNVWSLLWPISIIGSILEFLKYFKKQYLSEKILIAIIPIAYLLYICIQAPFSRYFILVLPFSYLALSSFIKQIILRKNGKLFI